MALVTTIPLKIGDAKREPGYELTPEDMIGRNVAGMLKAGHVMVAPDAPKRGRAKAEPAGDE